MQTDEVEEMKRDTRSLRGLQAEDRPRNEREAACWDFLTSEGWWIDRRGWPDFLCTMDTAAGPAIFCVEVKRHPEDEPREEQLNVMQTLERAGIPCFVWDKHTGFRRMGSRCYMHEFGSQPEDKPFPIPSAVRCFICDGAGRYYTGNPQERTLPCDRCNGSGLAAVRIVQSR